MKRALLIFSILMISILVAYAVVEPPQESLSPQEGKTPPPSEGGQPTPTIGQPTAGGTSDLTEEQKYNLEHFGDVRGPQFGDGAAEDTADATTGDKTAEKPASKEPAAQQSTYGTPGAGTTRAANVLKAYKEYKGLAAYTTLIWPEYGDWVQQNREKLNQQFCFATGIKNCLQSRICGAIIPVQASNVLAGPGPTGQFVSSASIVAERSLPLDVEGMTTQQLIELFGTTSASINGERVDFNDPDFDPAQLGPIQLRLYHIQFGLTNNAEDQGRLMWNVEFLIGQNIRRKWFGQDQPLEYGAHIECDGTPGCHIYKLSATTYTDACLVFDKGLPVGTTYGRGVEWFNPTPTYQPYLCVPFVEYNGGPTSIGQASGGTQPSSAAPPAGAGGNI